MRILIVEDDAELAGQLRSSIEGAGLVADVVHDGKQAAFIGATEDFDAAILDLGLPGMDGVSVLQHWREQGCAMPVLILTSRSRWSDKLAGFGAGADDFLTKPFQLEEVTLRIRALLRRSYGHPGTVLQVGPLQLDTSTGRFSLDNAPLALTAQEQRILSYMIHRRDQLVSRLEIIEHVYSRDLDPDSNTIDVLVSRIRRKLGKPLIETERGRGFRLVTPTA